MRRFVYWLPLLLLLASSAQAATKLACVGDSITHGSGATPGNSYPDQLQRMFGSDYTVKNFGVSGATLLNHGDKPYQQQNLFHPALDFKPDVVVIMLGTNDSKPQNWKFKDEFTPDYKDLIAKFQNLDSHPKIFIVLPPPVPNGGNFKINDEAITTELPVITALAKDLNLGLIDVHAAMLHHPELFKDNVHPTTDGATLLAATVYESIIGKPYAGPSPVKP
jgi:lysophospholipase L1-like esterase